ncbi:THO complex subunit 7 homolog isoform X2 [Panthera uncia]|uniref:THO complex subunit 7 homolog isoform X2 n=1 Tax=Panthera uncia TaxID=29064 RepID=UPI0020FFE76B|nr:THO complex subunit 7 homolog isoform X2 [Panthera uncia]
MKIYVSLGFNLPFSCHDPGLLCPARTLAPGCRTGQQEPHLELLVITCPALLFYLFSSPWSKNEVIRKRLLIDGDGAGDDRRINLLVKSFIKWCNSGSQEEGYSQYQRMLSTLSQCEFSMGKTLLVYDMNLREMENYEKIYKEIECSIAGAHEKIAECKKQILQAKRIRKNRQGKGFVEFSAQMLYYYYFITLLLYYYFHAVFNVVW